MKKKILVYKRATLEALKVFGLDGQEIPQDSFNKVPSEYDGMKLFPYQKGANKGLYRLRIKAGTTTEWLYATIGDKLLNPAHWTLLWTISSEREGVYLRAYKPSQLKKGKKPSQGQYPSAAGN